MLDRLAIDLLEYESLDGAAVYDLIENMTGHSLGPARPSTEPETEEPSEAEETIVATEAEPDNETQADGPGAEPLPAPST